MPFANSIPSDSAANRYFGSHVEGPPQPHRLTPDNDLPDIPPPSYSNGRQDSNASTYQPHVAPSSFLPQDADGRQESQQHIDAEACKSVLEAAELPGAEAIVRMQKMLEEPRAETLLQEYVNPATGKNWWYDLVTGEALFELPDGPHVILRCSH